MTLLLMDEEVENQWRFMSNNTFWIIGFSRLELALLLLTYPVMLGVEIGQDA